MTKERMTKEMLEHLEKLVAESVSEEVLKKSKEFYARVFAQFSLEMNHQTLGAVMATYSMMHDLLFAEEKEKDTAELHFFVHTQLECMKKLMMPQYGLPHK